MKRALLVGIDDYDHFPPLDGCVNDVNALVPLLSRHEGATLNFECQKHTSSADRVTRDLMLKDVEALLAPGADIALLYFAGHGFQETNNVTLVTADGTYQSPGIKLSDLLAHIQSSSVGEIIVILDCCFSGAAGSWQRPSVGDIGCGPAPRPVDTYR